jgi:hypothetical protein
MESILETIFNDVISKSDDDPQTAMNWFVTAIVVAVIVAGLSFGFKALRKSMAKRFGVEDRLGFHSVSVCFLYFWGFFQSGISAAIFSTLLKSVLC